MPNFPNTTVVHTGVDLLTPASRMPIGGAEGMTALIDDIRKQGRALSDSIYPEPGTIGETAVPITEDVDGSLYTLSIDDATDRYHGVYSGYLITLDRRTATAWLEWEDAQYGLYDCPYKRSAGIAYTVSTAYRSYPQPAVAAGGLVRFKTYTHAMGHYTTPDSVTDNEDGTLTLTVTNAAGHGAFAGGGAWAAGGQRRVIVWKITPAVAGSDSVYHGVIESNGTILTIDVPHTFGQATPSTTAAQYVFLMPGLIISPPGYTVAANYWHIATVTDGTVVTSGQRLYPLPSDNGFDIRELKRRVLHPTMPGCYFGTLAATRDVADACVITTPAGFVTATLTNPDSISGVPADWLILTGGRLCDEFKAGGLTVSMADTAATATYIVYVDYEEVGGVPQAKLAITDVTTFNSDYSDRLPIRAFAFDTTTNAVSGELAVSLELYRLGGLPAGQETNGLGAHVADLVLYGGRVNLAAAAAKVLVRANGGDLQVLTADGSTDLDVSDVTQRLFNVGRDSSTVATLKMYGPGGSGVLGASDVAGLDLGKSGSGFGIYQLGGATDADHTLHVAMKSARTTPIVRIAQSGGQQTDTIGSARQVVEVPDVRLIDAQGKLVTVRVPVPPVADFAVPSGGWVWDATMRLWNGGDTDGDLIYIPIPDAGWPGRGPAYVSGGGTGIPAKLVKLSVHMSVADGNGSDTVTGRIVRVDPTATVTTPTYTAMSGTATWVTGDDGLKHLPETSTGTTDDDGEATGFSMDPGYEYYLEMESNSTGTLTRVLRWVKAVYRVREFGAGCP